MPKKCGTTLVMWNRPGAVPGGGSCTAGVAHLPSRITRGGGCVMRDPAKARAAQEAVFAPLRAAYLRNPKRCPQCWDAIPWKMRLKTECCSRTCAAYRMHGTTGSKKLRPPVNKYCPGCSKRLAPKRHYCSAKCQQVVAWKKRRAEIERSGEISNGSPVVIRRYLRDARGNACEICHTSEWMGAPVPLIADHIDGHAENNKITNLRLVCSNCDGQLPTSRGRNLGNGRVKRRVFYAKHGYC